jgi:ribonuclease BN (tRNA processing enzyme)
LKISDKNILVDCGSGTLRQLEKVGLSYKDIDVVFFTHFDADHINDLKPLIQALDWTPDFVRRKELVLVGPVGFKKFCQRLFSLTSGKLNLDHVYPLRIKEIKNNLKFKSFTVTATKTIHSENSVAYKFQSQGKSLVISGDCDFDEGIIRLSRNVNCLLLECSFPNSRKTAGHLIAKECGLIAQKAQVKKLILTHLYPVLPEIIRLKQVKVIFKKTILARDLMKIEI